MKQNTQNITYIKIKVRTLQNKTEEYKTYSHIQNDEECNQKNMKECGKRKSHISSEFRMINISPNNVRRPVTISFTTLHLNTLHYTCRHFTSSQFNFTQLHFATLSFGLTPFKFSTALVAYLRWRSDVIQTAREQLKGKEFDSWLNIVHVPCNWQE
jgi:hypothetical protein